MKFNEKQSKLIYEFVMKYNLEEEFRSSVQELYDDKIYQLSILYIYALEEVLRYGTKGIFNKFLEINGMDVEEQAFDSFDQFIRLLNEDSKFKQYKMEQLKYFPDTLSSLEMLAFTLIGKSQSKKEKMQDGMTEELEYDPFNPILYSTDRQIRQTLENLFFGEFIHRMLELPVMVPVKFRQKEDGRIANIDKQFIIEKIQGLLAEQKSVSQFKQIIDNRYVKVKFDLLLGKGEEAFKEYLKFNTNISANEILGIEKDNTVDDIYDYLKSLVKKKKEQDRRNLKK